MSRVSELRALAHTADSSPDPHLEVVLARLLPHLTAAERRDWCWAEIWNVEQRRRVHAAHSAARGNYGPAEAAAARVDRACRRAVEWDDHRATHPRVTAWPARYSQCDDTCTVDCGHCKGDHSHLQSGAYLGRPS